MKKNLILLIVVSLIIIGGGSYYLLNKTKDATQTTTAPTPQTPTSNVEIRDGIQYVTISAKNGYSPKTSSAKAGMPTKLIVKTNGTFDCSASFVIKQLSFHKILQPTGEEIIDIGTFKNGEKLRGTCSMGMYNFIVTFE